MIKRSTLMAFVASAMLGAGAIVGAPVAFADTPPAAQKPAQPPAQQPTESVENQEIVVPGAKLEDAVRSFVDDVAQTAGEDQLARWGRKVCPGVAGANARAAQALNDRIAARALQLNLQIGQPGCRANVLVLVTPDAAAFTPRFVDTNKRLFGYYQTTGTNTQGRDALNKFMNTNRPVRWWHVAQTVTDNGQVLGEPIVGEMVIAPVGNSGRLTGGTRQDFNRVIVIVDAPSIRGLPFDALADYIAMVSLAQINPDASIPETPTILNVFADRAAGRVPVSALTEWDEAYLAGLYGAPRYARSNTLQENSIVAKMKDNLNEQPGSGERK